MAVANQYGIDLAGIQAGWDNSQQNALRTMFMGKQMKQLDREAETQGILDENTTGALAGDQAALGRITSRKPELGTAIMSRLASLDKDARDRTLKEAPIVARLLGGVRDQESYARAVEGLNAAGVKAGKLPMQYDPGFVEQRLTVARAMTAPDFHFAEGANGPVAIDKNTLQATPIAGVGAKPDTELGKLLAFKNSLKPGDPQRALIDQALNKLTTDQTLVEISDPTSPSGTRYVPRSQAIGQPGKAAPGLKMVSDGQGGFTFEQGRGVGSGGLSNPTVTKLEDEAFTGATQLARLNQIERGYKPEYQQIPTRLGNTWTAVQEKLGMTPSPQDKKLLQEYATYRRDAAENANKTVRDMTGATMNATEVPRLMNQMPNPGQGLFDGDSPTEFEAKLKGTVAAMRNSVLRANWARSKGMDPLKTGIALDEVPAMVEKRGAEIEKRVRGTNPNADDTAVSEAVRLQLGREFGLSK